MEGVPSSNGYKGGFGSAVLEFMAEHNYHDTQVKIMGIPDEFIVHATVSEQMVMCEIDADAITQQIKEIL